MINNFFSFTVPVEAYFSNKCIMKCKLNIHKCFDLLKLLNILWDCQSYKNTKNPQLNYKAAVSCKIGRLRVLIPEIPIELVIYLY